MGISEELKSKTLRYYEKNKPYFDKIANEIKSKRKFVIIPVYIDQVLDSIRYNVEEKRFDLITLTMATDDITQSDWLPDGSVYAGEIKFVDVPLPPPNKSLPQTQKAAA